MLNIVKYIPKYTVSKFKSTEYINVKENMVYGVNSFNQYGDTYTHWELGRKKFKPYSKIRGEFNQSVMERIKEFQAEKRLILTQQRIHINIRKILNHRDLIVFF